MKIFLRRSSFSSDPVNFSNPYQASNPYHTQPGKRDLDVSHRVHVENGLGNFSNQNHHGPINPNGSQQGREQIDQISNN
jgi:hypothetical protein